MMKGLEEIIAAEMYEIRHEGTWENLPEDKKEIWLVDAGFIAEAVEEFLEKRKLTTTANKAKR